MVGGWVSEREPIGHFSGILFPRLKLMNEIESIEPVTQLALLAPLFFHEEAHKMFRINSLKRISRLAP